MEKFWINYIQEIFPLLLWIISVQKRGHFSYVRIGHLLDESKHCCFKCLMLRTMFTLAKCILNPIIMALKALVITGMEVALIGNP